MTWPDYAWQVRVLFCLLLFFFLSFFLSARREMWVWLEQFLCESFGSFLLISAVWIPTFRCLLKNQRVLLALQVIVNDVV